MNELYRMSVLHINFCQETEVFLGKNKFEKRYIISLYMTE